MDDLISRQAAIEAIKRHKHDILDGEKLDKGIEYGYAAAHNHICDVISHMPTAKRVRNGKRERKNMMKWIPVTERLPKKNSEYLVTKKDHITYERLIDIAYYGSFIHENNGFNKADDIVAWMPLPEPWRGEW